jgi:Tol biopolymer transport system component
VTELPSGLRTTDRARYGRRLLSHSERPERGTSRTQGVDRTPGRGLPGGSRARRRAAGALLLSATLAAPLVGAPRGGTSTTSITTSLSSAQDSSAAHHTSFSFRPWISGDARYIAFDSDSPSLVPGDTNRVRDVFIFDRNNGTLERVSQAVGGKQPDGDSQRPTLSADGRYVAFWSAADNLVDSDTNKVTDCFLYDRDSHTTVRMDVGPADIQANGECARPVISADGKLVAFESAATNLEKPSVLGKSTDTNKTRDVFVRDLIANTTTRVSVTTEGKQATGDSVRPSIAANGRFVAFQSEAPLQADDTNKKTDVYLRDLETNETTRVSIGPGGAEGNAGSFSPSLNSDGTLLAYWSNASNFVPGDSNKVGDVFIFDRNDGSTTRISVGPNDEGGDGMSSDPSMSPDGRYTAFWSGATNLVPDDSNGKRDIFLYDRDAGTLARVSVADDGAQGDGDSFSPNINSGGGLVAFDSAAKTLVADDRKTKGSDIFLHSEDTPTTAAPPSDQPAGPPDASPAPADSSNPPPDQSSPPPDNSSPPADNAPTNDGSR